MNGRMTEVDATQAIKQFFSLHDERVKFYKKLDEGHMIYLQTSPNYDFPAFRQVTHDCTQEFLRISKQIIAIEGRFRTEFHNAEIAKLIGRVQENEQKKLELNGQLQLAKQRYQDDPGDETQGEVSQLKLKSNLIVSQIAELLEDLRYEAEDLLT